MIELILDILGFLLISLLFKCTLLMAVFLTIFAIIRANSGGYHAKTAGRCFIIITAMALISIWFANNVAINPLTYIVILAISSFIILAFSPIDSFEKPLNFKMKNKCKRITVLNILALDIFIAIMIFVLNKQSNWINIIILAIFWQSISMLPNLIKGKGEITYEKA